MVQDDVAAVAVQAEEQGAAFLPLEALLAGRGQPGRAVVAVTRGGGRHSAVRISGLPDGGLAAASFTSTRTGWAVVGTGTCAHFKTDCTQASALYTTTDGGPTGL